jgi:hypothetical protein
MVTRRSLRFRLAALVPQAKHRIIPWWIAVAAIRAEPSARQGTGSRTEHHD